MASNWNLSVAASTDDRFTTLLSAATGCLRGGTRLRRLTDAGGIFYWLVFSSIGNHYV
jgi:hypothetical protein